MVDLETFIKDAIVSIGRGVASAEGQLGASMLIAPRIKTVTADGVNRFTSEDAAPQIQSIEFDIAVTVTQESSKAGEASGQGSLKSGGVLAVVGIDSAVDLEGKTQRGESYTDSRVSRVKFSVPVVFNCGSSFQINKTTQYSALKTPADNRPKVGTR